MLFYIHSAISLRRMKTKLCKTLSQKLAVILERQTDSHIPITERAISVQKSVLKLQYVRRFFFFLLHMNDAS